MSSLRVLHVHNYYLQPGGEDTAFASEVDLLRRRGHDVIEHVVRNERISASGRAGVALGTIWSRSGARELRKVLSEARPDVAHFHNTFPLISPSAYYACARAMVPVVQALDNPRLLCPSANFYRAGRLCERCLGRTPWPGVLHACYHGSRLHTAVVASMLTAHRWMGTWQSKIDVYVVATDFYRTKFIEGGLPRDRIVVKPHFVDPLPARPDEQPGGYALFVGRLDAEKGVRTLLSAWRALPDVPLVIRGDGQLEAEVTGFIRQQGADRNVSVVGRLSRAELTETIRNARFLVWPSEGYYETFGYVAVESFSCGVPVIASRIGVPADLVTDRVTGLHFSAGDPTDLAATVRWAWDHPNEMAQMGRNARAEFERRYTPDRNYAALMEVYERAIGSRRERADRCGSADATGRAGARRRGERAPRRYAPDAHRVHARHPVPGVRAGLGQSPGVMRIGIDNISAGEATSRNAPGGMREYITQLIAEFRRQAPQHQIVVFAPRWADPVADDDAGVETVTLPGVPRAKGARVLYQQTVLPVAIRRAHVDVFFAIATVAPLAIRPPVVLSVQFLQFYTMPAAYGRFRTAYLRALVPASVRKAARTIVFTRSAADDLVQFVGADRERVRVVPHGINSALLAASRCPEAAPGLAHVRDLTGGRPYVVCVSATYPYKNHLALIDAFARAKKTAVLPHALVIVGSEAGVSFRQLRQKASDAGIADSVVITGRVEDVAPFYRHADLAVMPSLHETFGFPVIEPMVFGCPVLTSNVGAMAELAGDAAVLVDPNDNQAIADGIVRGLTDATLRTTLPLRARERAGGFSWAATAAQTLKVLEEAAG